MLEADRKQFVIKAAKLNAECVMAVRAGKTNVGMAPDGAGRLKPVPYLAMREDAKDGSHAITVSNEKGETILLLLAEEKEFERLAKEELEKLEAQAAPVPEPVASYYTRPSDRPAPLDEPSAWSSFKGMVLKLFGRA